MLSGVLNIGISYTFAPVLMEAVKDFTRQYPGVRLNIICRTMEELLELPEIDFTSGRIHEVLLACQELRNQGEQVVLQVSGPFTILNVLMDARYVF